MENFKLIRKNIDISDFRKELSIFLQNGNDWSLRRSRLPVQKETKNIDIRKVVLKVKKKKYSREELTRMASNSEYHELDFKNYPYFIKTYDFLERFADEIEGQLSKVMIVSLAPYSRVYPHTDEGTYYLSKNRYHLPIKTPGSVNICGSEKQIYKEGEIWWFNNKKTHEALNLDKEERVHIIFDILPKKRNIFRKFRDVSEKYLIMYHYNNI